METKKHIAQEQAGSALVYVFLAIGLLGALTFTFMDSGGENVVQQQAQRMAEQVHMQAGLIKSAILECVIEYPDGGGDLDGDTDIDTDDNENIPYPLNAQDTNNPETEAADDEVRNIQCPGAPSGDRFIFAANEGGHHLPPPPSGFGEWEYFNTSDGVYLTILGSTTSSSIPLALNILDGRYDSCVGATNLDTLCGATCFVIYLKRNTACP